MTDKTTKDKIINFVAMCNQSSKNVTVLDVSALMDTTNEYVWEVIRDYNSTVSATQRLILDLAPFEEAIEDFEALIEDPTEVSAEDTPDSTGETVEEETPEETKPPKDIKKLLAVALGAVAVIGILVAVVVGFGGSPTTTNADSGEQVTDVVEVTSYQQSMIDLFASVPEALQPSLQDVTLIQGCHPRRTVCLPTTFDPIGLDKGNTRTEASETWANSIWMSDSMFNGDLAVDTLSVATHEAAQAWIYNILPTCTLRTTVSSTFQTSSIPKENNAHLADSIVLYLLGDSAETFFRSEPVTASEAALIDGMLASC